MLSTMMWPTTWQGCLAIGSYIYTLVSTRITTQRTRVTDPMLDQCWATVWDAGPTSIQHWAIVSYLLGGGLTCLPVYHVYPHKNCPVFMRINHLWPNKLHWIWSDVVCDGRFNLEDINFSKYFSVHLKPELLKECRFQINKKYQLITQQVQL